MHNGNVYAGGRFIFSGDLPLVHIAKWDGEKWHALGNFDGNISRQVIASFTVKME